jgi:hypothetical protein
MDLISLTDSWNPNALAMVDVVSNATIHVPVSRYHRVAGVIDRT